MQRTDLPSKCDCRGSQHSHRSSVIVTLLSSVSIAALWSVLSVAPASADCIVTATSATCDTNAPNPYPGPTIGSGPATASGFTVTIAPNAQVNITSPSENQNAISLSDNANIAIASGGLVQNNATQSAAVGPYGLGWNTIEFRNNNSLTNYGTIISNGTANNAEPIEVVGTGNTIINHGTIQAVRSGLNAIFFQPGGSNSVAHSTVKCNGQISGAEENLARGLVAEYLSGARVEFVLDPLDIGIGQNREVGTFWEVLPEEAVSVFVEAAFPRVIGLGKIG